MKMRTSLCIMSLMIKRGIIAFASVTLSDNKFNTSCRWLKHITLRNIKLNFLSRDTIDIINSSLRGLIRLAQVIVNNE